MSSRFAAAALRCYTASDSNDSADHAHSGAVAGLGSAILCWFLGTRLATLVRPAATPLARGPQYALLAFLLIPALILAVVALFWVPPRVSGEGPLPEGRIWRLALVLIFVAAFISGLVR